MAAVSSSWSLPATAPIPMRARRPPGMAPQGDLPSPAPVAPPRLPPSFPKQLALGFAIFAAVLAAAAPLAFFSEGSALATAVGVGSVLVALLARRLCIALMIAALLAVLSAFAATHSIHNLDAPVYPIRLAELAPADGRDVRSERAALVPAAW